MHIELNSRSLRVFKNRILYPPPAVAGMLEFARELICNGGGGGRRGTAPSFSLRTYQSFHGPCITCWSPSEAQAPGESGQNYVLSNMALTFLKTGVYRLCP